MWDPLRPEMEPMSPALTGRFFTTEPPRKSLSSCLLSASVQSVSSVQSLSCVRLCEPMNRSTPGLPVDHQLPEFTQTHVHRVSDAWRRLLRVPWTARRSNRSILKEVSCGCSLEGLMLKLKLQYFGHLVQRTDSFETTLMLGKIEGGRRRG